MANNWADNRPKGSKGTVIHCSTPFVINGILAGDSVSYCEMLTLFSSWDGLDQRRSSEFLSEDQLVHLKTYRYQSVDKSLISRYILKHYVRLYPNCKLQIIEGGPC